MELRRRKGGGNERDEAETDKKGASSARNGARQPQSSSIAVLSISVGRFQHAAVGADCLRSMLVAWQVLRAAHRCVLRPDIRLCAPSPLSPVPNLIAPVSHACRCRRRGVQLLGADSLSP
eukprot:3701512-Rhodomonas_salina.2